MVGGVGMRAELEDAKGESAKVFQWNLVPSVRSPCGSGGHQPAGDLLNASLSADADGVGGGGGQGEGKGVEAAGCGQEDQEGPGGAREVLLLRLPHGMPRTKSS